MAKSPAEPSFEPTRPLELLAQFESLVGEVIRLCAQGSAGVDVARAQGAADGFARALVTAGLASEKDLLRVAQSARRGGAPGTRSLAPQQDTAELLAGERVSTTRAVRALSIG